MIVPAQKSVHLKGTKKFKKYFNDNGIEVDFFLSCWDKEGKQYDYNSTGNLVNIDKSFFKDTNIETQNIKFDKKQTQTSYSKKSFIYNFLSSMRQKVNDPLGKRKQREDIRK